MPLSHLPALLSHGFAALAAWLDRRTAARLPLLLAGILFACRRRTVTAWFRAADIRDEFRAAYHTVWAVGREADHMAVSVLGVVRPLLPVNGRLFFAIDDTPTPRYGPQVEGAGIHHNPSPGPAGEKFVYGHVWVTLAWLGKHPAWDTLALPLRAALYIRVKALPKVPPQRRPAFRTKLEMAAEQLHWLKIWLPAGREVWVVVDGGYAKQPFLRAARDEDVVVISRLPRNAALRSLPDLRRRTGQRGPLPTYGKERFDLAKRAGQRRGWQRVECVQYGQRVVKTVKTFLATWRPAGGVIRVVLVQEEHGWVAFFSTDPQAGVADVLEGAADRGAQEQTFKDVKEVWGAGQQQVRNLDASVGAFHLNAWMHTLVESWAWGRPQEELMDRSQSPWDSAERRPSHADKRKALQREILRGEIEAVLAEPPDPQRFRELAETLLRLAA
jgi:hypothetical protein